MTQIFDYVELESLLSANDASVSAAEAHGILTALFCIEIHAEFHQWLTEIFGDRKDDLFSQDLKVLGDIFEQTRDCLDRPDFKFTLAIPDDDTALSERAAALCDWSRGFLHGLGHGGDQRSADWNEILRDIVEISRLDPNAEGEDNEQAFMELIEYLRVAIHLIRSGIQNNSDRSPSLYY